MVSTESAAISDGVQTTGTVSVSVFRTRDLRNADSKWAGYSKSEKLERVADVSAEPIQEFETKNVTCRELHYLLVDILDGSQTITEIVDALAVGRSSTQPAETDTSLNDHVADVDITAYDDRSATLRIRSFIDTDEANVDTGAGETLSEAGLKAGDYFLSHALFSSGIAKDNTVQVTVTYDLIFDAQ